MHIRRIVLTGAPCSGKTTLIKAAQTYFKEKNIIFLTLNETATELMSYGFTRDDIFAFQQAVFDYQMFKEDFCLHSISKLLNNQPDNNRRYVILLDRALCDGKAYLTDTQWKMLINSKQITESKLSQRYDAVIYLESCVALDKKLYSKESNLYRSETNTEALLLEKKAKQCYVGTNIPSYVIPAKKNFDDKKKLFINILDELLTK